MKEIKKDNQNIDSEITKRAKRKQFKRRFKIGENEKEIIKMVGLGVIAVSAIALPGLALALKPFLKKQGPSGLEKLLKQLNHKKIIYLGGEKIELTSKGKQLFKDIQIQDIEIKQPEKWDGVWHLVGYDVPINLNKNRDQFRLALKQWNFFQIQKSLWVYPYDCKEEVAVLAEYLNLAEYVIVMNTDYLPNEEEIEEYFEL